MQISVFSPNAGKYGPKKHQIGHVLHVREKLKYYFFFGLSLTRVFEMVYSKMVIPEK